MRGHSYARRGLFEVWLTAIATVGIGVTLTTPAIAQEAGSVPTSAIHGAVTTQKRTVFLPGVVVTVIDALSEAPVAETTTDDIGRYRITSLRAGTYAVHAALDGFDAGVKQSVAVLDGQDVEINIDLGLAKIVERVDVQAGRHELPLEPSSTMSAGVGTDLEVGPVKGDTFQALLPTLPGIVRGNAGQISIKGATPTQSSIQVNAANATDPSTGTLGFDLPNDAIASVDVLTNPYTAEYGRFSSGVTTLNTTRGGPTWTFTPNGFVPRLLHSQSDWWHIEGIRSFSPRVAIGGPLAPGKVFLFENILYHYVRTPIPGLPDDQTPILEELKTFSRIDANLSARHLLYATFATFPQKVDYANLNTFNLKEVTTNFERGGFNFSVSDRVTFSNTKLFESTVAVKRYDAQVGGQGVADMEITPDGNLGNYFNRQTRDSTTYQVVEALTLTSRGATGEHLVKLGADLLQVGYDGLSSSSPVNVLREDGTLEERIQFGGPGLLGSMTTQHVTSTEAAVIAQDHWSVSNRVLVELGARIDHDGVLSRTNFTPRVGGVVGLRPEGQTVVRGGIGLFYDRTPLNVGAFESFESRNVTQYAADGTTIVGAPIAFVNRTAPDLQTPYSRIWNVELDHRLNEQWSVKANYLERAGHHAFIINPVLDGPVPEILLTSSGESQYRETELSARFAPSLRFETTVSYVRSHAEADLNSYDQFFGNMRDPLIRPNEYGLASTDSPNRIVIRGSYDLFWQVHFDPLVEVHTGYPLSTFAEDQSYIGPRNGTGRFPRFSSFDFSVQRPVRVWKYRAIVALRLFNALNNFNPRDAQRNIASPMFGGFYNPVVREFRINIELRK